MRGIASLVSRNRDAVGNGSPEKWGRLDSWWVASNSIAPSTAGLDAGSLRTLVELTTVPPVGLDFGARGHWNSG